MRTTTSLIACAMLIGCNGLLDDGGEAGIWLSTHHVTDTIEGTARVMVTLRDAGDGRVPHEQIHCSPITLCRGHGLQVGHQAWIRTNDLGWSWLDVPFGSHAGESEVVLGWREHAETVRITTVPGNAVGVAHAPADTAVLVGESFDSDVRRADRNGNARPEIVTTIAAESDDPDVIVAGGTRLLAVSPGITSVRAHTAEGTATLRAAVLPDEQLAVYPGPKLITPTGAPAGTLPSVAAQCLSWHPDGGRFLTSGLRIVQLDGTESHVNPELGAAAGCGIFTRDGEWIYYRGGEREIRRVRADGTDAAIVLSGGGVVSSFSPSPDGSRLAYLWQGALGTTGFVIHDVMTGAADTIENPGSGVTRGSVSWSPTGEWIAADAIISFLYGREMITYRVLGILRPDASLVRGVAGDYWLKAGSEWSWSPDGRWLVASEYDTGRLLFMDVEGGTHALSTARTAGFASPSWRPPGQ